MTLFVGPVGIEPKTEGFIRWGQRSDRSVRSVSSELDCIPYPWCRMGLVRLEVVCSIEFIAKVRVGSDHPDLARKHWRLMLYHDLA